MPTDNHDYNTPGKGSPDWDVPLVENYTALDADVEVRDTDTNKSEYTPKDGALFRATDTGTLYLGDGTDWTTAPLDATGLTTDEVAIPQLHTHARYGTVVVWIDDTDYVASGPDTELARDTDAGVVLRTAASAANHVHLTEGRFTGTENDDGWLVRLVDTALTGAGRDATTLQWADGATPTSHMVLMDTGVAGSSVANIGFDGNKANVSGGLQLVEMADPGSTVTNVRVVENVDDGVECGFGNGPQATIRGVYGKNLDEAAVEVESANVVVSDVVADGCGSAVRVEGHDSRVADNINISNVTAIDPTAPGVLMQDARRVNLTNVVVRGAGDDSIEVRKPSDVGNSHIAISNVAVINPASGVGNLTLGDASATFDGDPQAEHVSLNNVRVSGADSFRAVRLWGVRDVTIDGLHVENAGDHCIGVQNSGDFTTEGVTVRDWVMEGSASHAIRFSEPPAAPITFTDGRFRSVADTWLNLPDAATVERVDGYVTANSGASTVANTDTIAHGLADTPTSVELTASAGGHIAAATAVDGSTITVGLHDDTGSAVTTAETVYWKAEV